jgi:Secretion system C-terminal sorting domain
LKAVLFILLIFSGPSLMAQTFDWERFYPKPGFQQVLDIIEADSGEFIFVGYKKEILNPIGVIGKIDDQGDTLFINEFTMPPKPFSTMEIIFRTPFENGYSIGGTLQDSVGLLVGDGKIFFFDEQLNFLRMINTGNLYSNLIALPDGGFMLLGKFQNPGYSFDFWVARIDSLGNELFLTPYPRPTTQFAMDLMPMADGSYLVGGNSYENFPAPAGEYLIKIDHQGNLIDSSYLTNNTIYNHSFIQFAFGFNGERNQTAVFFDYPNGEFYDKQFIGLDSQLWAIGDPNSLFYPHVLNDSTINITTSDQNKLKPLIISNSGNLISSAIGLNTDGKTVTSSLIDTYGNLYFGGSHYITSTSQNNFYFAKFSGIGQEYIPDFCLLSPPQAWFGFEYDGQTLTLRDSSFAGMIYHDSVYKYEWFFQGIPLGISVDSFSIPYDTTIQPSNPEVKLIIHNFYRCSDTLTLNLPLAPTGLTQGPLPDFRIQAWPNPSTGWINLKFPENSGRLVVLNSRGEVVFRQNINNQLLSTDISQWAPGIYFFRYSLNGKIHVGKIVKN